MNPDNNNQLESLEDQGSVVTGDQATAAPTQPTPTGPLPKRRFSVRLKALSRRFNVYSLGFILVLLIGIMAIVISMRLDDTDKNANTLQTDSLTAEELSKLQNTDAKVGDPKQTLTIESNTIINGKVLLRDDLDVAGTIKVGGSLNLPGITVSGTSNFDQIQASRLAITGDTTIQGQLNVQKNLTVTGSASFGGTLSATQLNIQTLQLSGDLQLNRHLDAGGGTPSKSDGSAIGGGGTSSVSGSDTAGTVTINTGSSPASGCLVTVTFAQKFNATPHVVITPIGSGAAGLNYYLNRSSSNFSVCSTNAPSAGISFSFDYIAID